MPGGLRSACVAFVVATLAAAAAGAQTPPSAVSSTAETRASLEAEAAAAEAGNRKDDAWVLRQRLLHGDFREGDRIVVTFLGPPAVVAPGPRNDTLTLRPGKILSFPQMGDLSLEGVLRSEVTGKITAHLGRYVKDPELRITPLIRLSMLGRVRMPGTFYTTLDVRISDLLTQGGAGGPTGDFSTVVIRRGAEILWKAEDTQVALREGLSLEQLRLQPGDEIVVEADESKGFDWTRTLQIGMSLLGTIFALLRITRR